MILQGGYFEVMVQRVLGHKLFLNALHSRVAESLRRFVEWTNKVIWQLLPHKARVFWTRKLVVESKLRIYRWFQFLGII